jgi:hypothetical protein
MSTRAIIGIKNNEGSITGAWQWNDGGGLTSLLNKKFNTIDKVVELINQGMWNCMFSKKEAEEYEKWLKDNLYKNRNKDIPPHKYMSINGIQLLKDERYYERLPETYKSFDDAIGQDINYLYLFDTDTNKWECFR